MVFLLLSTVGPRKNSGKYVDCRMTDGLLMLGESGANKRFESIIIDIFLL